MKTMARCCLERAATRAAPLREAQKFQCLVDELVDECLASGLPGARRQNHHDCN